MRAQGGKTNIRASTIDANVVNALFGLGLVYLNRHETDRARDLLGDLVRLKTDFEGKNQFLFNDLGIALRKSGLYPEAIAFFLRALEYVGDDENLYYNLARAHYENNDWEKCLEYLIQSHRLNPNLSLPGIFSRSWSALKSARPDLSVTTSPRCHPMWPRVPGRSWQPEPAG